MSIQSDKYIDDLINDTRNYRIKLMQETRIQLMKMLARKGKSDEHIKILLETLETDRREEQELLDQRDSKKKDLSV
jgi:hypothetical protein